MKTREPPLSSKKDRAKGEENAGDEASPMRRFRAVADVVFHAPVDAVRKAEKQKKRKRPK
jgi:hypothetical protein